MNWAREEFSLNRGGLKKQFPISNLLSVAIFCQLNLRLFGGVAWLVGAVLLVGCGTPKFNHGAMNVSAGPMIPAAQVKLFDAGSPPPAYRVVSGLSAMGMGFSGAKGRAAMQAEAGKLGADAVIGVHSFVVSNYVDSEHRTGIAVRLAKGESGENPGVVPGALAIVPLVEAAADKAGDLPVAQGVMELFGAIYAHEKGYCPIHVSAQVPSGTNIPAKPTFELLRGTEAATCEKMLVLRLTGRDFSDRTLWAWNHFDLTAQLISRENNAVLWEKTTGKTIVAVRRPLDVLLPLPRFTIAPTDTAYVMTVVEKAMKTLPRNERVR